MSGGWFDIAYLVAIVLFILGIKRLGKVRTAQRGNQFAAVAMLLVVVGAIGELNARPDFVGVDWTWIIAGAVVGGLVGGIAAKKVEMTEMPEMVALFNGSGGAASVFVVLAYLANYIGVGVPEETDSSLRELLGG